MHIGSNESQHGQCSFALATASDPLGTMPRAGSRCLAVWLNNRVSRPPINQNHHGSGATSSSPASRSRLATHRRQIPSIEMETEMEIEEAQG